MLLFSLSYLKDGKILSTVSNKKIEISKQAFSKNINYLTLYTDRI